MKTSPEKKRRDDVPIFHEWILRCGSFTCIQYLSQACDTLGRLWDKFYG